MSFLPTLLANRPLFNPPQNLVELLIELVGWLAFLGLILYFTNRWRGYNRPRHSRFWIMLGVLALAVPLTSLFIGVRLPSTGSLTPLNLPVDPQDPVLMVFIAVPWMLAGGLLGPAAAAILGGFSGLLLGLWGTQNPFTPLVFALLAVFFSVAMQQRYRTPGFAWLRRPLVSAFLLGLAHPVIYVFIAFLAANGDFASRLDYALTRVTMASLSVLGELLIGGLVAEIIAAGLPELWKTREPLKPSPVESSLQARFLYTIAPLAVVLTLLLMVGDWIVAEQAARRLLGDRLADAAGMPAEAIPYFTGTGQNLIQRIAQDPRLLEASTSEVSSILQQSVLDSAFFSELYMLDAQGKSLGGYPRQEYNSTQAAPDEQVNVQLAMEEIFFQSLAVPPVSQEDETAYVSFIQTVVDDSQSVRGVLVGRSSLATNPLTKPVIISLKNLAGDDSDVYLLDDGGHILFHPDRALLWQEYAGRSTQQADFFDDIAPDGTRRLVYYQPVASNSWALVLSVPARRVQLMALNIAAPLLGMIGILALVSVGLLRLGMRSITSSLAELAGQAGQIAQGKLEAPLAVSGEDEVAQLSRAFEQMRQSLKARMDELNRLLLVSQGVASHLEVSAAVRPVLESALSTGAASARVVLMPAMLPELEGVAQEPVIHALGSAGNSYAYLDEQILEVTRQQERVVMHNPLRPRIFQFPTDQLHPESLVALPLRHENLYYGALWVAYDNAHQFSDDELRFFGTLAGQAALAAANGRLFSTAEIGRQRLAAVLASTPDPVLVTDQQNRLLLSNPAAWRVLGLGVEWDEGQPIERIITQPELLGLLTTPEDEKRSLEVTLADERVYYATVSPVLAESQRVGRVCILRDISYFKELDALKSEFVATVSHDLRSPLTLMRGYATMLEMVGELNEQQTNYVRRIIGGVESMSRLVNNLLDLGRIEAGVGLQLEMVPVQDIVERVINTLQLQATQKRVKLGAHIPESTIPLIEADQALLQQALHNLVDNAIKYTEAGGQVRVGVSMRPDSLVFEVKDSGIGIAPVDQPRLFEKFFRGVQQGAKKEGGTGLGLAIVKSIAERHGGEAWMESQLGKGSTFFLSIPLRQEKIIS